MIQSNKIYDVIIIGAGASGCAAAISCAEHGRSVLLLEKNSKIAKKILVTGNGRCNFTNLNMSEACYHGAASLIHCAIDEYKPEDAIMFMREIGIESYDRNGYCYPLSNQAKSVVMALSDCLESKNVMVKCNQKLVRTWKEEGLFYVLTDSDYAYVGKNLVIASGLIGNEGNGLDNSAFSLIQSFGHSIKKCYPALVGVICKGYDFKLIAGLRVRGQVTLIIDDEPVQTEIGELQFTEYGISGIPVFQLSSTAAQAFANQKRVKFCIRFLPEYDDVVLLEMLKQRFEKFKNPLNGLIPDKMTELFQKELKNQFDAKKCHELLLHFNMDMKEIRDFKYAQVAAGGIPSDELRENSFESALVPNLYFAGELLDVDGICGGYNLHFAWATGTLVGRMIHD